jgi:hypothetical protein
MKEMESVYCAVGTESLHKTYYVYFLVCIKWRRAVLIYELGTGVLNLLDFQLVNEKQCDIAIIYHAFTVCDLICVSGARDKQCVK